MGLTTSMWSGVTGLMAHGERMAVIGNNLANVNTTAYKGAYMQFMDLMSQDIGTAAGTGQVGRGVRIGAVYADFSQGGIETTNEALDMAIGGNGFFMVKEKSQLGSNGQAVNTGNLTTYYTRDGSFRFDKDGYLVNSLGLCVQGWEVDQDRIRRNTAQGVATTSTPITGSITDVRLDQFQSPAQATENVTVITNLDSTSTSQNDRTIADEYFAMSLQWDGTSATPMPDTAYSYQETIKVYDQNGSPHNLTVYYDKIKTEGGKEYWEYVVACDPNEDGRFNPDDDPLTGTPYKGTEMAGLLMMGTMTFDASGSLENTSAYTLKNPTAPGAVNLADWTTATVSNGYPTFTANFKSISNASFPNSLGALNISLNMGIRNNTGFTNGAAGNSAADVGNDPANLAYFNPASLKINSNVTTNYAESSITLFRSQDGYPSGLLTGVSVDENGVLTGTFSNGQVQQLYAIALADFTNPWGLRREGNNLFSETLDSGQGATGQANTGRLGAIAGNSLETSNVDMAAEMVDMILTQRGFQANSKVITTVDTMLGEVIQLKR